MNIISSLSKATEIINFNHKHKQRPYNIILQFTKANFSNTRVLHGGIRYDEFSQKPSNGTISFSKE
ncbi:hypothetical protein RchiOBHm_Chr6g0256011 [Rosa chinensis]|uniref:Uncharacterized protein n=1 Tax=Rosa chinensis TaxID=74649 RepID=A0A2P6PM05_ROSCH|nr:hypothetical protein RchiOBHm_Chr6g0256011 [Rosa chinensis]